MISVALLLAAVGLTQAVPFKSALEKRQSLAQFNDVDILNYALTLEHLEDKFYREGLANFTQAQFAAAGFDATFYRYLQEISSDETIHVNFLTAGITAAGVQAVKECTYAFGVTSVESFVATASILEGVGTSAYLGAAPQIASKAYLLAAGSVLSIEARHSSYIRSSLKQLPFPQPQEIPLTPNEVFTLASPFIVSCPSDNPTFPVRAYPKLVLTSTGPVTVGSKITVSTPGYVLAPVTGSNAPLFASFASAGGPVNAELTRMGNGMDYSITIPEGVAGLNYLRLSNCGDATHLSEDQILAGPVVVEITKA
ncbi:unnamed protein product [Zymoseptoria tritici ST99CH_1A5]|uniref:Uncharacterized protein n=3 Tax=Zymoseptoria tritici TaxID=1047171 RepID=A0A2H1GB11_ZYMTR|nr:unnamed protein product [Zymoseptoria tritici ST99CH_1E4]SMR51698.1 unnamed protein product [Zymoseptoria tritici ST99CH_3D1]SMY23463.1 unnamed protein product [Zymoseptoria tritici ST99CH_1A5]